MANERRLIDLDKLIETLKATKVSEYYPDWNDMTPLGKAVVLRTIRAYREVVLNQPTVDAVEVVRCKDCKWAEYGKDYPPYCKHWKSGLYADIKDDDFCSYGERWCK